MPPDPRSVPRGTAHGRGPGQRSRAGRQRVPPGVGAPCGRVHDMNRILVVTPDATVPMLALPPGLPLPATLFVTAIALAVLDMGGAIAAKNWALTHSNMWFIGGVAVFTVLFWTYGSALQYADLSIVTMGWIVVLQVGLIVVDHVQYGVTFTPGQWLAITGVLSLQGYLVLSSS